MIPVALGVLSASLLGSVHCTAMCGGFTCLWSSDRRAHTAATQTTSQHIAPSVAYNVGRLVSYGMLGALAGTLGAEITRAGALVGVARGATVVAGLLMVLWGASTMAARWGVRVRMAHAPAWWQRGIGAVLRRFHHQPAVVRAGTMGLLTTLLPCGWLYAFVATAGGTGNARDGLLLMGVFWVGTLPAMVTVGYGAQRLFGPLQRRLPLLGAATVMVLGLLTLAGRLNMGAVAPSAPHAVVHQGMP